MPLKAQQDSGTEKLVQRRREPFGVYVCDMCTRPKNRVDAGVACDTSPDLGLYHNLHFI
jgi:hypothetical protein